MTSNNPSSLISSYGTVISYDTSSSILTLKLTDSTLQTNRIILDGFKTFLSTRPVVYSFQLLYQDIVYFYFSSTISVINPKEISKLSLTQGSNKAYSLNDLTMTIS